MTVYVFDANTVVSAALNPAGVPRRAIELGRANGMIALSSAVYQEISEVIARPKFARILSSARQLEILEFLSAAALWFEPAETVTDCRDRKDNRYLELAVTAGATVIVSGDSDLLVLHPWRGIEVLRPATFIALFSTD